MRPELCGYVLAGGQSSRMGVDKAEMRLCGRTLLEIAAGKLAGNCGEVVVVGQRDAPPKGLRVIGDRWIGCGPVGGIEAALTDLSERGPRGGAGRRAMFLPVDMPLVPLRLIEGLLELWAGSRARACLLMANGRAQPLVSMVSPDLLPEVRDALDRGEYKVRPMLEAGERERREGRVLRTEILTGVRETVWPGWLPTEAEWETRELWFSNLNTREEFAAAERSAASLFPG